MKLFGNAIDGLSLNNPQAVLILTFDKEFLMIEEMGNKGFKSIIVNKFKIPLSNIQATLTTTEKEFVEKSKSVIGRGIAGGFLFGPAGLVLGGLSGVGKKKKGNINHYYIISYMSSDNTVKNITFTLPGTTLKAINSFDTTLKTSAGFPDEPEFREIIL